MTVRKICCLGLGPIGVSMSAVIAYKCPEIKVTFVQTDPDQTFQWNAKQLPTSICAPGLGDFIRKCRNKNLFFTAHDESCIKEADMVFIISESRLKRFGEGKNGALDYSGIESSANLIAEASQSNKIVVETSAIPLKAAEVVKKALLHNARPGVRFQVLSNPEFYEEGSALQDLLYPDRVLIGSDDTPEGYAAARELILIYERWVKPQNIVTKSHWLVELVKTSSCAFKTQRMTNIYALSAICEETGADIVAVAKVLSKDSKIGSELLTPTPCGTKFLSIVSNLVYMCEYMGMVEVADYWRQVLDMNAFHCQRFLNRLISALSQTALDRRIAVLGFARFKDTMVTRGSASVELCRYLLGEGATLSIFDPCVSQAHVVRDLVAAGCSTTSGSLDKAVSVHDDPYKAVVRAHVIVIYAAWPEFKGLDFKKIFFEMMKPAYLFDSGNILPHSELTQIGFKVYTVGKTIKNS